ncbi:tRNA-intron lyase [Candidatus Geothermarchaeota archaeon]|nr:MAG: tRNA-intron lyase [Candidatus Geothermarchaeota archaeon]RLG62271.1 MAG: tRNA-intron lyase [Candidatus Geothermarchaeota archaeon]HEW94292.1 tRNA-intron lyase [Thermoprotei archaeon]
MKVFKGIYLNTRVIIWDTEEARELWKLGFYGKPLGIPKPKSPDFESPLILDLIESLYLVDEGLLKVYDIDGEELDRERFIEYASKEYENFLDKYKVYRDLRKKGFIVLSGLKFGVDFAVYRKGPGLEHAPYLVDVVKPDTLISSDELVRAGRLATSVRKRFIIAYPEDDQIIYLMFKWRKP